MRRSRMIRAGLARYRRLIGPVGDSRDTGQSAAQAATLVEQDRPQPGAEAELVVVSVAELEGREKRFLHGVLGPVAWGQSFLGHAHQRRTIAADQLRESVVLARLHARDEVAIGFRVSRI